MSRSVVWSLCLLVAVSLPAFGQDPTGGAARDTLPIDRLRSEIDWRRLIRVYTIEGGYELERPRLTTEGLEYDEVKALDVLVEDGLRLQNPLPAWAVVRIEVREGGKRGVGAAVGAGVGLLTGIFLAEGLESGDTLASSVRLGLVLVPFGALLGLFVGEGFYEWKPIYERQ